MQFLASAVERLGIQLDSVAQDTAVGLHIDQVQTVDVALSIAVPSSVSGSK